MIEDMDTDEFEESLIDQVRPHPMLYAKGTDAFKLGKQKSLLWKKIATVLDCDKTKLMKKWKRMYDRFFVEFRHSKNKSGDGVNDCYESDWPHYESLMFSKDTNKPAPSEGNLDHLSDKESRPTSPKQTIRLSPIVICPKTSISTNTNVMTSQSVNSEQKIPANSSIEIMFFKTLLPQTRRIKPQELEELKRMNVQVDQSREYHTDFNFTPRNLLDSHNRTPDNQIKNLMQKSKASDGDEIRDDPYHKLSQHKSNKIGMTPNITASTRNPFQRIPIPLLHFSMRSERREAYKKRDRKSTHGSTPTE
ncbi:hypothetical protein TKK_0012265 [Trichogramma kaykai]